MNDMRAWQRELGRHREKLELVHERMTEYVVETDIPLELVQEERRLSARIRLLQRRMDRATPLELLRTATKLLAGPVARTLEGRPWTSLRQQLLARACGPPRSSYLDTASLARMADDLAQLIREVQVLLDAHRIEPNPGQLEAVERRAAQLGWYLLHIYRLPSGMAPELEALVSDARSRGTISDVCEQSTAEIPPQWKDACQKVGVMPTQVV